MPLPGRCVKKRTLQVLGGSFRQGPKKHPAVLPEEVAMFNFYVCFSFYRLWKKGKTNGISTLIWTLTAKTHLAKNPNEGFGCQNPTKTNPSLLSFWFCRHYLDVLRTHSTRTPTLGTVQRNTSASLLRSRLLASGCGHGTRDASNFPLSLEIPTEFSPQTKHIDHVSAVFGPLEILKLSLCHGNMSQQSNIASSLYSRLQPSSFCCVVWGLYIGLQAALLQLLISSLHVKKNLAQLAIPIKVRLSLNLGTLFTLLRSPKNWVFHKKTRGTGRHWPIGFNIFPRLHSAFEAVFSLFNFLNTSQRTHVVLHRQPREVTGMCFPKAP